MIITCEQCHSKFRLDDERIKETGSKVRCSKCKHVFTVFLTAVEPTDQEPIPPVSEDQDATMSFVDSEEPAMPPDPEEEEENFDFDFLEKEELENEGSPEESLEFDLEDIELEPAEEEEAVSEEIPGSDIEALDEAPLELEIEGLEEAKASTEAVLVSEKEEMPEESLNLELGDIEVGEEEEFPSEEASSETVRSESESLEEEGIEASSNLTLEKEGTEVSENKPEEAVAGKESGIELSGNAIVMTDAEETQSPSDKEEEEFSSGVEEDDFALGDITEEEIDTAVDIESSAQWEEEGEESLDPAEIKEMEEISFDEESEEAEEASPEDAPLIAQSKRRKRPSLLLLILLIVASIAGGIYAAISLFEPLKSGINIPYLNITIGGEKPVQNDSGNLKIALLDTKGYFEENEGTGTLFIIAGHIRNDYSKNRSLVRVKGILYDKSGNIVKTKSVYCGNILTKTELENLSVAEINKKLLLQSGTNQSNVNIAPNTMIPFMVVFEDLPSGLGEYSVEVEGSV
jgi:predicted Zn finger-like uncharacterized protein